jgi:hypothetical protein
MEIERAIRQGLRRAGLDDGWVELLAVHLVPDHPGWRTKKLYKFLCPRWLAVNIVTGGNHRMNHVIAGGVFDFGQPGVISVSGRTNYKIKTANIREVEIRFKALPDKWN